jgi:uncharacterized protein GlcG (DUF336 family)
VCFQQAPAGTVAHQRLDNAQLGSIAVAEDKARTSVLFRRPSKAFEDAVGGGGLFVSSFQIFC